jgi:hypothetical protein
VSVTSFPGILKLIMFLPGNKAALQRSAMVNVIRRYQAGDASLVPEIQSNFASDAPIAQLARESLINDPAMDGVDPQSKKRQLEPDAEELEVSERRHKSELSAFELYQRKSKFDLETAERTHELAERKTRLDMEATERKASLEQETIELKARLEQEATDRKARLEQEAIDRKARLEQEAIDRKARIDQEAVELNAKLKQEVAHTNHELAERKAKLEMEASERGREIADRKAKLELEASERGRELVERKAKLDLEAIERKAKLDLEATEHKAKLDLEATERKAKLDLEMMERTHQLAERKKTFDLEAADREVGTQHKVFQTYSSICSGDQAMDEKGCAVFKHSLLKIAAQTSPDTAVTTPVDGQDEGSTIGEMLMAMGYSFDATETRLIGLRMFNAYKRIHGVNPTQRQVHNGKSKTIVSIYSDGDCILVDATVTEYLAQKA